MLAGPDYSRAVVEATNPSIWAKAERAPARFSAIHGFETVGEIMEALNPLGKLYQEALGVAKIPMEMYSIVGAKFPHPETIVPGGVSTTINNHRFHDYVLRLLSLVDVAKRAGTLWEDVLGFFWEADPRFAGLGESPRNFIDTGLFEDPEAYDATYENMAQWGRRRWASPGVIVDGQLRTTDLRLINLGLEEFVTRSFYDEPDPARVHADPSGTPLSPHHPWNRRTRPHPQAERDGRYSWVTSPRWERTAMETGPGARLWITALANQLPRNDLIEATGSGLRFMLPNASLPELALEWKIPERWGTLERQRARIYAIVFAALVAAANTLKGFDLMKSANVKVSNKFQVPGRTRMGVGMAGGSGFLSHHLILEGGQITNYQVIAPSTWNLSPRGPAGDLGVCEAALLNTPILEEIRDGDFQGIDLLRTVRSFDPCVNCATH